MRRSRNVLINLNLFPSVPPSTDEYTLATQRISTRLFILSLSLSLTILLIYTAAVNIQKTVIVPNPSLDKYEQLHERYASTLTCPCTHISVKYDSFIRINYTLHQVCKSVYVTNEWITFVALSINELDTYIDPNMIVLITLRSLRSFCALVETHIFAGVLHFNSTIYISDVVTQRAIVEFQSDAQIEHFTSTIANNFVSSLELVNNIRKGDSFRLGFKQTFFLMVPLGPVLWQPVKPYRRDNCICDMNSTCTVPTFSQDSNSSAADRFVPGLYTGCDILETLRMSSLECFYNQTCVNHLQERLKSTHNTSLTALKSSETSRFPPNTTIGAILDQLMVEQWNRSVIYEDYYAACQPSECRYTLTTKNDALYIVTTLIGLMGGLVTALKIVVPELVSRVRKRLIRVPVSAGRSRIKRIHS